MFRPSIKIPNLPKNTAITLNGINLIQIENDQPEKEIIFLGIYMDQNLTWKYSKI